MRILPGMEFKNVSVVRRIGWLGCDRPSVAQMVWGGLFVTSLLASVVVLGRFDLPAAARATIPLVCLLLGIAYIRTAIADVRRQSDELQLRIYHEATSTTFYSFFIVLLVYPVFEKAGMVGALDSGVLLFGFVGLSVVSFVLAARRYR
jgi:hypothetical protein